MNINIIYDRTFDAVCAKRAGMDDLHDQIITRLIANYPEFKDYIQQCLDVYNNTGDFLTQPRGEWLKEHRDTMRLRYR